MYAHARRCRITRVGGWAVCLRFDLCTRGLINCRAPFLDPSQPCSVSFAGDSRELSEVFPSESADPPHLCPLAVPKFTCAGRRGRDVCVSVPVASVLPAPSLGTRRRG